MHLQDSVQDICRGYINAKGWRENLLYLVLLCAGMIIVGCNKQAGQEVPLPVGNLPVRVAAVVRAGESVSITVGPAAASNGTLVTLIAAGSYGPRIYQAAFQGKEAHFILSAQDTQQSGVVNLTARAGEAEGRAEFTIVPSSPVEPLTPLIGARAIIADAEHWSMTVLVPFDAYGNPVMEGTRVRVLVLHPGNRLEKKLLLVRHLLAWTRIFSRTKAGRSIIVAQIGQVHGFEGTLLEVAGWPVFFSLSAEPSSLPADGHLLTTLRTSIIRDRFGNIMPDGTSVTFLVDAPDGTRSYLPAYTIGGIAQAPFQAPREPGQYIIQATILGAESEKLILTFNSGPAVGTFLLAIHKDRVNNTYVLRAGPLLGSLGQYVPDGTPVRFMLANHGGLSQELDGVADAGYASIQMRPAQFPAGSYTVVVIVGSGQSSLKFTLP